MKRKTVEKFIIILAAGMLVTSSTGCGTKASATDAEVPIQEETVIVAQEDADTESDDQTIMETETVGSGIVFYTEWIGQFSDEPSTDFEFEPIDKEVTIEDNIAVEIGGGVVGYIEGGTAIRLIEHGINSSVYRVENLNNVGYEYIYVTEDDLLTLDDMKEFVALHFNEELSTVIDTPEGDMEYIEFTIEKSKRSGVEDYIWECIKDIESSYRTFCVECTKNDGLIDVKVYYK